MQDLLGKSVILWNAIIGEGDVKAPTKATIVLVQVRATGSGEKDRVLELVARANGKELIRQSVAVSTFITGKGEAMIPFLVYGTGCEPLELTATLAGAGKTDSLTRTVPFRCGE